MSRRNSSLFTIIMEYRGGTYITQVAAMMDTRNVWRHTQSIGGFVMLINMVATKKRKFFSSKA